MDTLTEQQQKMTSRFEFIAPLGTETGNGCISMLGENLSEFRQLADKATISPLGDRGVIAVTGPDVINLLQGQLTCDMSQLAATGSLKGALCDSKGRMVSSFLCLQRATDDVLLVVHRGLTGPTLETLRKYAVFYKVTLSDVTNEYLVFGIHGSTQPIAGAMTASISPELSLLVCPSLQGEELWNALTQTLIPTGDDFWSYLLINAGEGEVRPETQGEFIPQMLNLQATGAVNFRKGCYTGQEIVARMQYLGKLKRRMYHLETQGDSLCNPGDVVNCDGKANVGTVVLATAIEGGQSLLVVLTEEAAAAQSLEIGAYQGPVSRIELPYEGSLTETSGGQ